MVRILENPVGLSVDMVGLKPRGGQIGVLYWDAQTQLVKRLEQYDRNVPRSFPYDKTEVSNDLATCEFIQTAQVGEFVALVLRTNSVEDGATSAGEPYLTIYGLDMDGVAVGPLRLWRWTQAESGIAIGSVYIIRGLEVAKETTWSDDAWKYVPREDGAQTVECGFRTAVEDVTNVAAIMEYFS